jgi:hypothetical protein
MADIKDQIDAPPTNWYKAGTSRDIDAACSRSL